MIFGSMPLDEAHGAVVAHTHRLPGRVLRKGTVLDSAAIAALRDGGHATVIATRLDPDEVMEDPAALRLATALVGPGLEVGPAATGRVNLLATQASLLRVRPAPIDAVNQLDEALTVATLPDWSALGAGEMVATIKVIPFAVHEWVLAAAEQAARRLGPAFEVRAFKPMRYGLVLSSLPGMKDSIIDGTIEAMAARIEGVRGTLLPPRRVAHDTAAIAASLRDLLREGAEALLIAGASATVDRRDIGPAAVVEAGGAIEHFGMPVDPGNLICLGRVGAVPALVLPGCARSPKTNGIDWVMQRLAAGLDVDGRDIMGMGVGGLLKESDVRPLPRARRRAAAAPSVAAIVLAAGRSSRAAPRNKLLTEGSDGITMLARTVDQALTSRARPVVVVLGHRADEMRAMLAGREVTTVVAHGHEQGLSASLRAGLAALPSSAQAVLVCLGDMPLVPGGVLDRLIAAWDPDEGRLVVQPTSAGRPGNPVLFDRTLFARLEALQGDAGARSLLSAMADEVTAVEVGTDAVLHDFDTPESLDLWATHATVPAAVAS